MKVKLLVDAGSMQPGPTLGQKLGPLGINIGQVIQKVNQATQSFKGMKVPVELDVDAGTKEFVVNVFSPPVSELLKKELNLEKGSGLQKKEKVGNISIEQIISVAKTKLPNLLAKDLKAAVKQVVGTCVSLGVLVENKNPVNIIQDIEKGKFDSEIQQEKTEISDDKKKRLDDFFEEFKKKQEEAIKKEEEEKEAEEAAAEAEKAEEGEEGKPEEKEEDKEKTESADKEKSEEKEKK